MLIFALDVINVFLLVISNKLSIFISKGYANISLSVKAAFWFVFCTLLQKAFSFVTVPIFTRIMSSDQYGLFNLYNAWLGIIVVLCTMNMESGVFVNGYVKEDIKEKEDVN